MVSNRRLLLKRSLALLTVSALAGCAEDEESADDDSADDDGDENSADDNGGDDGADDGGDDDTDETVTIAVGPGGENVFDPDEVTIEPGTTVEWTWESNGHNVVVDDAPDDADWEGDDDDTYNEGHTHEHTFEVPGEYEYYCSPHEAFGMTGTVVVEE